MRRQTDFESVRMTVDGSDPVLPDRYAPTVAPGPAVRTPPATSCAADPDQWSTAPRRPKAVVIGAGVSGCACAATLASAGVRVLLVNSAMDRVGLPAYGPDLLSSTGEWDAVESVVTSLPDPLRTIWSDAGLRPVDGGAVMNIDRRRVSIETKRLLEDVPGLRFRQGFVVDLRVVNGGGSARVQAETIFGEVFEADAAVVAVGLSLGGRTSQGGDSVEGGRYGEPPSSGLRGALMALGALFRERTLDVGLRVPISDLERLEEDGNALAARKIGLAGTGRTDPSRAWPEGYPPAPHLDSGLRCTVMLESPPTPRRDGASLTDPCLPWVSPDGAATGELYIAPRVPFVFGDPVPEQDARGEEDAGTVGSVSTGDAATCRESTRPVVTRVAARVVAQGVVNTDQSGRLSPASGALPVWVVGRAGGAEDYLQSLASGVEGALNMVAAFGTGEKGA